MVMYFAEFQSREFRFLRDFLLLVQFVSSWKSYNPLFFLLSRTLGEMIIHKRASPAKFLKIPLEFYKIYVFRRKFRILSEFSAPAEFRFPVDYHIIFRWISEKFWRQLFPTSFRFSDSAVSTLLNLNKTRKILD